MSRRFRNDDLDEKRRLLRAKKELASELPALDHTVGLPAAGPLDRPLLILIFVLSAVGLLTLFSATAGQAMAEGQGSVTLVLKQLTFFVLGFTLMFGISRVPFLVWMRLARPFSLIVIALLTYTLAMGVEAYGAERWIRIAGIQFQPSELSKISVVLLLAQALRIPCSQAKVKWLVNIALVMITVVLILKQPNLSMTMILSAITLMMCFIAGTPPAVITSVFTLGGCVIAHKIATTEYQWRRIVGWLNPWGDPQDTGYNLIQSLYAIGSGGLLGNGIGGSYQKHSYLPFHHTDFIFSIFAEEWGFIGSIALLGLFLAIFWRGIKIAQNSRSPFAQYLAMGITGVLALQVLINLSVTTGLMPVTGLTLPLVSNGGTSVLVTLMMLGILLNISRYQTTDEVQAA